MKIGDCDIVIKSISNGWIVNMPNPNGEGRIEAGFTYDDGLGVDFDEIEAKTLSNVLWGVLEQLKSFSKHDKYRVRIIVEKDGKILDE